jgi:hypothetical protein
MVLTMVFNTQVLVFMQLQLFDLLVRQDNFLFHMAFHIKKGKLACRTLYIPVGIFV